MQGIKLLFVGKTDSPHIKAMIAEYERRLSRYVPLEIEEIPDIKNRKSLTFEQQKEEEGRAILATINSPQDEVVLLDEQGKMPTSQQFAKFIEEKQMRIPRKLIFVIGGPYGFSKEVYSAYHQKLSLGNMTFSHQMIRLFLIEQIYRAYTIINHHPYHHE